MREFKVGEDVVAWLGAHDEEIVRIEREIPEGEKWAGEFSVTFSTCGTKGIIPRDQLSPMKSESDPINHPDHYQSESGIECIDAIRAALTPEEFRGYCKGAALKYIWRERKKGGDESLGKGVWYLNEAQK